MKKRVLSLMLASSLILSCMPADSVFAAETTQGDEITSEEVSEEQEKIEVSESEEVQQGYESLEETSEMEEEAGKKQNEEEENSTETDPAANMESETQDVQQIENEGKENGEHSSEANLGEVIDEEQGIDQKAGVSVAAASQDYGDLSEYDVYLANQLINYGRYDFMTQEYQSACEIYVRSGKENGLSSKIAAWRALTFDGASEVGYAQAEVGYYEAILFDLVYDEEGGGVENAIYNNIMDASEAVKASNWKKICEGGEEALMNMPVSEDNLEAVYSVVQKCDSLQGILDKIGNVTDILGYVDSGKDFLDKLSELSVLVSVSDETQEIITDLAESYNKVDAMNAALDEYALLFTDLMDETTILSYLAGRTTLEELSKEWAGGLWKSVITKMNSAGLAVEVGQTIGKMASDFLVSTDGIIETFYSMEAMTKFTELLTSQVRTYGERFKSDSSVENAKKFNAAFELLYKAHVINLDYAEDFLNQVKTEGFINWLFQGTEDENYQENLRSINNMKEDFSTYIDTKKAITLSLYQEEYPSNIDTGLKDVEVKIPVSDEQLAVIETEIESVSERISDLTFSEDKTFNADVVHYGNITLKKGTLDLNGYNMTVYGDLYIQGGMLRLSGGHLIVNGNVYHSGGMLYLSEGTFETNENYWLGSENADGTMNTSNGEIKMDAESDYLRVTGDFYMYSRYGSNIQWTEGTTEIGGNLYKYHDNINHTGISEDHKIIFTGEKDVVISSEGYKQLNLANVEILNSASRKVTLSGDIGISGSLTCDSEELKISAQDAVLSGDGFSNVKLVVDSDLTYDSGTWSLNGKSLQVKGDMYQDGGNLNLETGNIIVDGSYYHQNGMLNLSGGTMEIGGTYYLGLKEKDGSIKISNGTIKMENASDLLKVAGDFYMYSRAGSDIQWTEGVTEIGGNLYKYHEDINSTRISGNHKTVFTGKKDVVISSQGYKQLNFANVEILNAGSRKVTLEGDIDISESLTCDSEELTLYTQNAVLSGNGFSDVNLNIDSDITYDGGTWSLSGKKLQIKGNMYQNGGILKLMGGTLEIGGTYYLGMKEPDGTIHTSGGEIRMIDESDLLKVAGDIYLYSDFGSNIQWTEGTTEIGGNLYKYHYYNTNNTGISGNHKMRFTGEKDLIISSKGERQLDLANVEILNAADRKVTMEGDIGISGSLTCDNEKLTISAQEAVLSGNGFSNLNLIVDSNLTYDSGTWLLNGKDLQVNGDVYQKGGILNLGKGSLAVSGSYYHQGGTLNPSGGSVDIGENYYNAVPGIDSSSGDPVYNTSSGLLYMNNPASFMNVAGDFVVASSQSHSDKLTAGTIAIQGDFTQISGNAYNFACDENMTVILNGKNVQYVSFASPNSKFNILQLTKDKDTGYVFSPDPCWNELEEVRDEFAILVQPEDCAAAEGGQAVFTVKASGDELSYQWQYCEPEGDEWKDVELVESMSDTLTIPVTEDIDGQKYRCIVKNGEGESLTTEAAVLNVKYELTILQQPENFTGKAGDTAIFSVMAAGYQVSYQWQYQNAGSDEWRNSSMAGSSSSTLVVSVNSSRDGQKYRCVLTDGDGKRLVTDTVSIQIKEENPFTDVAQEQYYYDSILWAYENGIASGLSENEFAPDAQCTRAQVVIFLWRAKGQPKASLQELPFEDVEKGTYYYDAVAWAYENNIVSGGDGTHFGPDDPVSRGQFVTFLYRTEGKPGYTSENPFTDVAQWAYYYDAVLWAYENGIASGLSDGIFGAEESCTRGQVVTFLYRACN